MTDRHNVSRETSIEHGDHDCAPGASKTSGVNEALATPPEVATVFGDRLPPAVAYHESLRSDATVCGLIGPREAPRLWERHILNCAVIGELMDRDSRVVDIGSGAGLPGIPLAIARPDLDITLIEPQLRRVNYLKEIVGKLGLDNVSVVRGRAEEKTIKRQNRGADYVTSRAVAPLGKLMGWSLPLTRQHGLVLAMKGASAHEEIERDQRTISSAGGGECSVVEAGAGVLPDASIVVRCERR
ncbi:16S rRNA (guanine(527)-N(7))-methyltransferase RsmG [Corynebacterium kroppenstedtii]|uniref:16S rRNA (guanine(527)-N(7))-methyltransferase RsmG n=1 Tax=Corynebacterium kroppenstedtii TaxID=161879 RepID=UPI0038737138